MEALYGEVEEAATIIEAAQGQTSKSSVSDRQKLTNQWETEPSICRVHSSHKPLLYTESSMYSA